MLIDVITLFPEMFAGVFGESIIKRAVEKNILEIRFTQLRDFAFDKHRQVDDSPFGGGAGMVLKPEPVYRAVRDVLKKSDENFSRKIIITDPGGKVFTQAKAKELAALDQIIFVCGHYEGFDARIYDLADELISIGDYVLTGGELPAMGANAPECFRLGGIGNDRFFFRRVARISAIHAPARIRGKNCARSFAFGQPRANKKVA